LIKKGINPENVQPEKLHSQFDIRCNALTFSTEKNTEQKPCKENHIQEKEGQKERFKNRTSKK
jgi:hypothetical protein